MKTRIRDRILIPAAGVVLLLLAALLIADVYFNKLQFMWLGRQLAIDSIKRKIVFGVGIALLLIVGFYCISVMFRRIGRRKGFVVEKREGGELAISVKALESLVMKCIAPYEAVECKSIHLHNEREGLVIGLRIGVRRGTNIPMLADSLQKQIRQYVSDCTGCDVKRVYVQVDTMDVAGDQTAYHVPDPVDPVAEHQKTQETQETETDTKLPLHQRLFGHKDQPAELPLAPVEAAPPAPETAPETAAAEEPKPAEQTEVGPVSSSEPEQIEPLSETVDEAGSAEAEAEAASAAVEPAEALETPETTETENKETATPEELPFLDLWESEAKRDD